MTSIGVVMVTFGAGEQVNRTLDALGRARTALGGRHSVQLVVVDNASPDGAPAAARGPSAWTTLVELPRNDGFAAGSNAGIARLVGVELIVLLNPDVEVREDFLQRLAELHWPPSLAARGPAIFGADGDLEQSARGFPRARTGLLGRTSLLARLAPGSRLVRRDLRASLDAGPRTVDWVSGACLIVPAQRFQDVGPLDAGYFMYWEDADWCFRAGELGLSVVYEPALVVTHRQGSSSGSRPFATIVAFHLSALRYWRLHVARSPLSSAAVAIALSARCVLKLTAAAARLGSRGERSADS